MSRQDWEHAVDRDLAGLRERHLFRQRQLITPLDATHVEVEGRQYVNFASNNYLGLTHHPRVIEAARRAAQDYGAGSGAAPLITGYGPADLMMEIIGPDRVETIASVAMSLDQLHFVPFVLGDEHDSFAGPRCTCQRRDLAQEMRRALIFQFMAGIEPQVVV